MIYVTSIISLLFGLLIGLHWNFKLNADLFKHSQELLELNKALHERNVEIVRFSEEVHAQNGRLLDELNSVKGEE